MLLAAAVLGMGGCASPGYFLQAIGGQLEMIRLARPVAEVERDPDASPALRAKLAEAESIRDFASRELALPENGSYRKYAELGSPYAVWNVFAAEEFSVQPKAWCFPVAGCVNYRGYFAEADAEAFAAGLRGEGYDVSVGGVPAYSTLGWFDDPLLSTFINYSGTELARLIFHELAHQLLYVRDDTVFNESFATTVEREGLRRWLAQQNDPAERERYERMERIRADFRELVRRTRQELGTLYASRLATEEKRRTKARILAEMRRDYEALKAGPWQGFAGYDRWFGQEINNATLASVGLYQQLLPAFEALLAKDNHDLPRFYADVKRLAALPKEERHAQLARE